jgi:hypothetical protein
MTPGAVRKRAEREKRANARQYARATTGIMRMRGGNDASEEPEEKPKPEPQPVLVYMPAEDVAQKDAQQQRGEKYGGRRVTPKGTSGTFNNPDDNDGKDATRFQALNDFENQPSPRAKITFIPVGLGGPKDWTQSKLVKILTAMDKKNGAQAGERKKAIIEDLASILFEERGGEYCCHVCDFRDSWPNRTISHLEDSIEAEYLAYQAALEKQQEMYESYERLAMHHGTTPISVDEVVPGDHYRLFWEQATARKQRAREGRKKRTV